MPPEPLLADDGGALIAAAALLSLVVLITTANFPDVMLKAYSQSHPQLTFVFFASFLLLGLLCHEYVPRRGLHQLHASAGGRGGPRAARRDEALRFAFELVDFNNNGYVSIEDFVKMIRRLRAHFLL